MMKSEKGFTLIEIIIAIAILALLLSIASWSINSIYRNSLKANVYELQSDLQDIQYRTMTELDQEYALILEYDVSEGQYRYSIKLNGETIKTKTFPTHFLLQDQDRNDIRSSIAYKFSSGLGQGIPESMYTDGTSIIDFSSLNTDKEFQLMVVQLTGRVIVHE